MLTVIKRNGTEVPFDKEKITIAIEKAMNSTTGVFVEDQAEKIAREIEEYANTKEVPMSIYDIETEVYYKLINYNNPATARAYESYKSVQQYKREQNTTDNEILGLLNETNIDVMDENSNKNPIIASTQRDLIAGEVSKDIAKRKMIPLDLVEAHESGAIHIHDMDYIIQPIFNCCLVNMKDMLDNGTVVNGKMIENLSTAIETLGDVDMAEKMAKKMTQKDLESGIQTIQYQINTLMTSNGQAPFVTLFMHIKDGDIYENEVALIIEEILKQRIKGIKNDAGVYVTPAFPKLIYVLDENNIHKDSKYYYLTSLAIRCTAKRMYPDYISAKKMASNYEGNVFSPMGCRAFLPPYKDQKDKYKFDGRFNMGACTINLPQIGILANGDENKFFEILNKRLDLVKRVGLLRYEHLKKVTSDSSPIHWQHGAIARLGKHESIAPLLLDGYSTVSLGYIGIYEATYLTKGVSHTDAKGYPFAMRIMDTLNAAVKKWTKEYGIKFTLYATPAESLTNRFNSIDRKRFGIIENVTDKGYYTNSFHVDVREEISAFEKFSFESKFQDKSSGGCISYVEIPNMEHNLEALETIVRYIYDNIQYAEFNTKSDYCAECGFDGEIKLNEDGQWQCPQCGNTDRATLTVVRRTCGYLGENFWNEGRTKEIKDRVLHI